MDTDAMRVRGSGFFGLKTGSRGPIGQNGSRGPRRLAAVAKISGLASSSIRLAALVLAIGLGTLIVPPAHAQNSITIFFVGTNYVPSSFGRQLSFSIEPSFGLGNSLSGATLVVSLPPGVSFVSANSFDGFSTTLSSLSGSSATGETAKLAIGESFAGGLVTSNFVFDNVLTVSIGNTVADGTTLRATFDLSGTLTSTGATANSGPVPLSFQAGYLPVSVSVSNYSSECDGQVRNADFTSSNFRNTSTTGTATGGSLKSDLTAALGGLAAIANGASGTLSTASPGKVGEITGPGSAVLLRGIGGSALAYGGFALFPNPPFASSAFDLPASASCVHNTVTVDISFSNPNPYDVSLSRDERANVFLAAGNGAATNPFGFPGSVSASITESVPGGFEAGSGVATNSIFEHFVMTPNGDTEEVAQTLSCFPEGQTTCGFSPPSDTTTTTSDTSGFVVPPGVSTPGGSSEFRETAIDAQGRSNIETDATTGNVILVRSGYGSGSGAVSLRFYRGDANLPTLQAHEPAKLVVSGSSSPIELMVTDPQGHRTGFQAAPSPPPQFLNAQPSILTEIFGASYSGISSQPQVISIPDPDPAPTSFTATVTGTGTGTFTLTMQTLAINGTVISSQSSPGTASPGSTTNVNFTVQEDGTVSLVTPPSCATDVSSSVSVVRGGFGYNFFTGRFVQGVTMKNTSSSAISGPVSLVLDSLSSNAMLFNASGKTACAAPLGSPFITVVNSSSSLAAGQSVTVYLQFTDPTKAGITYSTRVLAGSGTP